MKRKFYVKPDTRLYSVELEDTFAGSAEVTNSKENTGRVERQEFNTAFDAISFDGNTWIDTGTED